MTPNSTEDAATDMCIRSECPLCGSTQSITLFPDNLPANIPPETLDPYAHNYKIEQCSDCELIFADPIPNETGIKQLYQSGISTGVGDSEGSNITKGEEENVRRTMNDYYTFVSGRLIDKRRFLDIGCDKGLLMQAAKADGFREIYGIEPNPSQASALSREGDFQAISGYYEDHVYPDNHFDLISMIHVLDHLPNPSTSIAKMQRELAPGGLVLAVVHDIKSLPARILGKHFPPLNLYHFFYFSRQTLIKLFEKENLEVIAVYSTKNVYSIGFLLEKIERIFFKNARISARVSKSPFGSIPLSIKLGNIGIIARKPKER